MSEMEQMSLLDLHPCRTCLGYGQVRDRSGELESCPTCNGTGQVEFDPHDESEIPF